MPNFPAVKAYSIIADPVDRTPMLDVCSHTKGREVSIPRGGTTADYNANLRGTGARLDKLPNPPYPPVP